MLVGHSDMLDDSESTADTQQSLGGCNDFNSEEVDVVWCEPAVGEQPELIKVPLNWDYR